MKKSIYLHSIGMFAIMTACAAQAQTSQSTPPKADAAEQTGFDDIVVTATRREESAQKVPVSVIALNATALEERNVRSLGDLTSVAPGIRFSQQGGGANMNVVIRGLQRTPSGNSPNAVISYFADIPLYFNGSNLPTFDLSNIQVLKGPQGTLFGRNAIGGAVIITPQAPTGEFEGYVRGSYGNYDYKNLEAAINIPIAGDRVALRLAGKLSRRDGYTRVIGAGDDADNMHQDSFRASLLLQPNDWIRNTTVFDWFEADEVGTGAILEGLTGGGVIRIPALAHFFDCNTINAFNPGCAAVPGVLPAGFDIDDALARQKAAGKRVTFSDIPQSLYRKTLGVSNKTEFEITDGLSVRNIFGYRETRIRTNLNTDGIETRPLPLINGHARDAQKQASDEFHVFGKLFEDRFDYLVGAFYNKEQPNGTSGTNYPVASGSGRWVTAYQTKTNKAVFGQFGFRIIDGLKLNAGIRYNETKVVGCSAVTPESVTLDNLPTSEPSIVAGNCPQAAGAAVLSGKENATTYNIGFDWQVSDKIFTYITHRTGYREGGLNYPLFSSPCVTGNATGVCATSPSPPDLRPYQRIRPERVKDVELGVKTEFQLGSEGRVRFNVSAFQTDYSNAVLTFNTSGIVASSDPSAPQFSAINVNVGKYRIKGFEAELLLQPTRSISLQNTVAYVKSKFVSGNFPKIPGLQNTLPLPGSPKWSINSSFRWVVPVRPLDGEIVANVDFYHQGSFYAGGDVIPGYEVVNSRVEWSGISGTGISVAAFARNLLNKTYPIAGVAATNALGQITRAYAEPRMYGIELAYKF